MFSRTALKKSALQTNKVLRNTLFCLWHYFGLLLLGRRIYGDEPSTSGSYHDASWFLRPTFPNRKNRDNSMGLTIFTFLFTGF